MQRDPWGRPLWAARTQPARSRLGLVPAPRPSPLAREVETAEPVDTTVPAISPATEGPVVSLGDERADLRRRSAELEAVKRRVEREALRAEEATRAELVSQLIPVLDNLDRTLDAGSSDAALLSGVELVRTQLEQVLRSHGLVRIDAVGKPFDPSQHEAVATAPVVDPAKDGVVIEALSRGYCMRGRVLAPARVRVGKLVR